MFSLSILGWIDDYIGTQEIKGISGHVNVFIQQKRITTGLLKAAGGTVIALMVTFPIAQNLFHWLILTLLVMLSIHLYNLLDTRPGRSLKAFWLVLLPFIFIIGFVDSLFIFLPLIIATMIMFQYDRKRKAMLGDTGSNMLGGVIGFLMAYYAPFILQIVFLILLIGLSVVAEKHSFSAYIKRTPWLRKIDQWGLR
jgi:UDP-N-acetylmuramyl pentapeptide phosphotransferase/UDP-N-acetylglucosamine-1-phosphate transferase